MSCSAIGFWVITIEFGIEDRAYIELPGLEEYKDLGGDHLGMAEAQDSACRRSTTSMI